MFKQMIVGIVGLLIRLRYRVIIKGLEDLECQIGKKEGILFLPNHVAAIDPVILMQAIWTKFHPRPIVVDDYYYGKGLQFIMWLLRALPCPNMDYGVNRWKVRQLDKLQERIATGLKQGDNYLIYPSGKLKLTEQEIIGGASFIPNLLEKAPDAKVVLVRITGLWGSRFSCALTGKAPNFSDNLRASLGVLLKNLVFFTPRRSVHIECCIAPQDFPYQSDRLTLNRYLEKWYNSVPDRLARISYAFWKEDLLPILSVSSKKTTSSTISIPESMRKAVIEKLAEIAHLDIGQISDEKQLVRDLGLDSLDVAQFTLFLDEKYQVGQIQAEASVSVGELLQLTATKQYVEEASSTIECSHPIIEEKNRPVPKPPQGKTIMEAFFLACERKPSAIACMDAGAGALSYRKLKAGVLLLADEIRQMPGHNIGIMLPSSVGAYLIILATLCAGKVPVMLNWTVGSKAVNHAIATTGVEVILSSLRFLNRAKNLDIGSAEDKIVLLEEVRREIGLKKKLRAYWRSLKGANHLLKRLSLHNIAPSDPAVILFTSGTETLPKGVPLSHGNILSNQSAALEVAGLENTDFLYGILPPFHSFGFSVTGLLPLLSCLKVFYAPDPTNHRGMVRDIATYKCTFFCSAPTFIRNLFYAATVQDLASLRLIVTGAEKAGKELFDYVEKSLPHAQLLEGYGITECSPIVTLCRPHAEGVTTNIGVGVPLPGTELLIIDPESGEERALGAEGEVCITGPGVFNGYLDGTKNPFIEKRGKKWYRSGDQGYLTPEGALVLSGRLKRFIKVGGEMISLGGLEEEIAQIAEQEGLIASFSQDQQDGTTNKGPAFALCAIEKNGQKTALTLYTTHTIDKETLNTFLKRRGHSNLMRISEVRTLEQIPLTGTGKTNYRLLEEIFGKS